MDKGYPSGHQIDSPTEFSAFKPKPGRRGQKTGAAKEKQREHDMPFNVVTFLLGSAGAIGAATFHFTGPAVAQSERSRRLVLPR